MHKAEKSLGRIRFLAGCDKRQWKVCLICDTINYSVQGVIFVSYLTAALLGLVQGVTEFLPISSSGHLALLQNLFHIEEADLMFDVMLHLGTLLAIFISYKNDVKGMLRGGIGLIGLGKDGRRPRGGAKLRKRLALLIILGSLPMALVLPVYGRLYTLSKNSVFVGVMLLITGGILYLSDRYSRPRKDFQKATLLDVLLVGLGQAMAVIPGISRSGTTISLGLIRGFQRPFAVKFSFLLSIPAVLGAAVISLVDAIRLGVDPGMLPLYGVGMGAAALSGLFSMRLLRWAAARNHFGGFCYYCWGAGIVALLLSLVA